MIAGDALVRGGTLDIGGESNARPGRDRHQDRGATRILLDPESAPHTGGRAKGPRALPSRAAAAYLVHTMVEQGTGPRPGVGTCRCGHDLRRYAFSADLPDRVNAPLTPRNAERFSATDAREPMDDLLQEFIAETRETLAALSGEIVAWESMPADRCTTRFDLPLRPHGEGKLRLPGPAAPAPSQPCRRGCACCRSRWSARVPDAALVSAVLAIVDRIGEVVEAIDARRAARRFVRRPVDRRAGGGCRTRGRPDRAQPGRRAHRPAAFASTSICSTG